MIEQGPKVEYVSCADTAKLVRAALRKAFPAVKFSVRSSVYSGGASIRVGWVDGPSTKAVELVVKPYAGGRFDGMIDLAYSVEHVLMPDGSAILAHSPGTANSRGSDPEVHGPAELAEIVQGARLVNFLADHVFATRDLSETARAAVEAWVAMHEQPEDDGRTWIPDPLGHYGHTDWPGGHTWYAAERLARRADIAAGALTEDQAR